MTMTERPNIVLVFTDQQQGAMMGCDGHPHLRTPAMDRLGTEGVRFDRAFCASPQCSPSRAALLTGLYPHTNTVRGNIPETRFGPAQLPPQLPGLGTRFAAAGYRCAYFGKWHLGRADDPLTNPLAYGFERFVPPQYHTMLAEAGSEDWLAAEAAAYISEYRDTRPFVLVASFNDPHGIYALSEATRPFEDTDRVQLPRSIHDDLATKPAAQRMYRDENSRADLAHLNEEQARRYLAWYTYLVERADRYLAQLLAALDARPDLATKTVVVFASDHGDLACAHGLVFKGPAMYEELVRIPLIVRGPRVARGVVRHDLVSLVDVLPTCCDLAGLTRQPPFQGESLLPLLRDERAVPAWRDAVIAEYQGKQKWSSPIRMIRTATHKLTLYRTGERELYDLVADPSEIVNRAGDPAYAAIERELSQRLHEWMVAHDDAFEQQEVTDARGHPLAV